MNYIPHVNNSKEHQADGGQITLDSVETVVASAADGL